MRERSEFAILRWIFSRWFVQSNVHKRNVRRAYAIIRLLLIEEFYEDSPASLKAFSDECYAHVWRFETDLIAANHPQQQRAADHQAGEGTRQPAPDFRVVQFDAQPQDHHADHGNATD